MGKSSVTVRTYSKRCPLKVMHTSSSRLTTPDTLEGGVTTLPTPATPSYLKDLTPSTASEMTSTASRRIGGGRRHSSGMFQVLSSRGISQTMTMSSKSQTPNSSPVTESPGATGTTQRQPTQVAKAVARNTRNISTSSSLHIETNPPRIVADTTQRGMRSCTLETIEGAPLPFTGASKRFWEASRNTELLSMELTCCTQNSTCKQNTTTAVDGMQKEFDADSTETLQQGDSPTPPGEAKEDESDNMEVNEVMRTVLDDIRTADPGMDVIPLEAKPPPSPMQEVEWPSTEDVSRRRKRSSNETGTIIVGSEDVQSCAFIPSAQNSRGVPPCGGDTGNGASVDVASKVSIESSSRSTHLQTSEGASSQDASTRELSLSQSRVECQLVCDNLELDEMDDDAENVTGGHDSLPRSSTPLLGNLKGKLMMAWDCSPVEHSNTLERLSADTGFQVFSSGSSSKSHEGSPGDSVAVTIHDKGTDIVQQSINVRRVRRCTSVGSNKRRASSQNRSWPKLMLKATTASTQAKSAANPHEQHGKRKASTTPPLNYDPYSFMCSNDSVELTLPIISVQHSLEPQSPSASQIECTRCTTKRTAELETTLALPASSPMSVCAIIHIGGGGLPPAWTLLRKGPRRLRRRKGRGSSGSGTTVQVDVLCTL